MILVDSSVWIDFFRGAQTPQAEALDGLLGAAPTVVGDLIVTEVLQGVRDQREFRLRDLGFTVRKTIDTLIATRCIQSNYALLHSDRDFDLFEAHLGLQVVRSGA